MGLDITCYLRKNIVCPNCGKVVGHTDLNEISFGGRVWYPLLEQLGYYVPHDQRTEENDWYGRDMILSAEQIEEVFNFVKENYEAYGAHSLGLMISAVRCHDGVLVINADW